MMRKRILGIILALAFGLARAATGNIQWTDAAIVEDATCAVTGLWASRVGTNKGIIYSCEGTPTKTWQLRNDGGSAGAETDPGVPLLDLVSYGDVCAGGEAVKRNAGDTANVCFTPGAGGVTDVTGTSPIVSSGGATPAISIGNADDDGATKGAASFADADFDATTGNVSIAAAITRDSEVPSLETDAAHDTCAEISGCVVGALTVEVDGSTTNELQNIFQTVDAPSGTDPAADSTTDTLALAASGIVTISGDSSTDTITIGATEVDGSTSNEIQNLFQTVDATSGTDPVADTSTDTLTLTAGTGMTVTGDATTDTVTIATTALLVEVDGSTTNEIQNLFQTVDATSGTDPVADTSTDTLTLTAGTGVTVTGDSSTDTITIATTVVDTNANTICTGTTTYLDGEGNCDDISSVYQGLDADLTDLADGSLTGTKVGFADTDNNFAATNVQAAIEELDDASGAGLPNQTDYKVNWDQIGNMPAAFADEIDDTGGGGANSFATWNAPAGTDPVASSATDTMNLAASGIVTITGDSGTKTLTFAATEVDGSTTNELQNIFQTVDAPSGTDPAADTTTDTLALAASGIVTISGDSSTDTITIGATEVDGSTSNEIQNLFQTVDATSGTDPVADTSTDTLTLTAGTGMTVTGDSTTDTVTIATTALLAEVDGSTTNEIQNLFATVDATSGTDPVADASTDTLTLTAGTGMTVTGDASTDTVTIATTAILTEVDGSTTNELQNIFQTVDAPSGTDPAADTTTDTLALAASGIVTITGDSSTDTITIGAAEVDGSTTNEIQNIFQTVDATSGTDPVADTSTDTLTLTAGTGMTVTGDSATDTVTIATTALLAEVDGSTTNEIQNLFQTIDATSGTDPVADTATDTLTLTAGTGITVTGDSATDTVTVAATLGTAIDSAEITNGEVAFADVNATQTLAGDPANGASSVWFGTTGMIFEGATSNGFETLLTAADPTTPDKTLTLPDETGTLCSTGSVCTGYQAGPLTSDVTTSGTTATIADNAVDGTDISLTSEALGDVMYFDGTNWVRLAKGNAGQVLEMNVGATAPEWDTDDSGGAGVWTDADPMAQSTTTRDVQIGPTQNNAAKLSVDGDADQVQLSIQGNATQTSGLVVIENSAGTDQFTLSNTGAGVFAGTLSASNLSGTNTGDDDVPDAGDFGALALTGAVTSSGLATSPGKSDAMQTSWYCQDASPNDTYDCDLTPAITSYVTGNQYWFKAGATNNGAASINFNGLGAKTIVKVAGGIATTLANNDIRAGQWVGMVYDGTNMQMLTMVGSGAGSGTVTQIDFGYGLSGGTVTTTGAVEFDYTRTLAGNPLLLAGLCMFASGVNENGVICEGQTVDNFEVALKFPDPTVDTTLTLPNETGTICSTGSVCTGYQAGPLTSDVTTSGTTATIADNAVDGTDISLTSEALGDVMYFDGTNWVRLAKGTAGQVLEMNADATAPEWDADDTGAGGGDSVSVDGGAVVDPNFDDGGDINFATTGSPATVTATVKADSVALTTDTTGNYVSSATANQGLLLTGTEGGSLGLATCTNGQILKNVSGTSWACAADDTGGSPTFSAISGSTNTTAAMVVGSGASLATSGTGTIAATSLATTGSAVVVSGAAPPAAPDIAGRALVSSSATTAAWTPIQKFTLLSGRRSGANIALGGGNSFQAIGMPALATTGTAAGAAVSGNVRGFIKYTTAASSLAVAGIKEPNVSTFLSAFKPIVSTIIHTDSTVSNRRFWFGSSQYNNGHILLGTNGTAGVAVVTTPTSLSSVYLIGIAFDTAVSANFRCCHGNATTYDCADTGVAVSTSTEYTLALDYTTSASLVCSVNGTTTTVSTYVPAHDITNNWYTTVGVQTLDSTAKAIQVSGWAYEQN